MHRFLAPEAYQNILPVQEAEALQVVNDLLDDPLVGPSFYITNASSIHVEVIRMCTLTLCVQLAPR